MRGYHLTQCCCIFMNDRKILSTSTWYICSWSTYWPFNSVTSLETGTCMRHGYGNSFWTPNDLLAWSCVSITNLLRIIRNVYEHYDVVLYTMVYQHFSIVTMDYFQRAIVSPLLFTLFVNDFEIGFLNMTTSVEIQTINAVIDACWWHGIDIWITRGIPEYAELITPVYRQIESHWQRE